MNDSPWRNIIGHDWAVDVLSGAIKHDRVGHAYLITGPSQVGKTTLARIFAMALNCTNDEGNRPCGTCRSCNLIRAGRHPDVRMLEPAVSARGKLSLKIDAFRDLQRNLQLAAYEGPYKIAIIRQFDAANINAANAFLKTLEEPPGKTVLILTATDADRLLDTIKSRCRVVSIRPIPTDIIHQALVTRWHVPQARAQLLAHLANGRLGWAVQAAEDETLLEARNEQIGLLRSILEGGLVERYKTADALARKPEALNGLLNMWLMWWRDLMLLANESSGTNIINIDQRDLLESLSQTWSAETIMASLKHTSDALWQLERNANIRLVLEVLFLTWPQLEAVAAPT